MNAPRCSMSVHVASAVLLLLAAGSALADPFVLATGRRDPRIYAIDLKAALSPRNNGMPNAIVSRSHTSPRHLDGRLLGDPANIVLSEDQRTAFVMNHHGAVDNARFTQHGGRASVAVMRVAIWLLASLLIATRAAALEVGDQAPDFSLADQNGTTVKLSDLRGKSNAVIAFYVMAFTPG